MWKGGSGEEVEGMCMERGGRKVEEKVNRSWRRRWRGGGEDVLKMCREVKESWRGEVEKR